jgi:hypothetical protein
MNPNNRTLALGLVFLTGAASGAFATHWWTAPPSSGIALSSARAQEQNQSAAKTQPSQSQPSAPAPAAPWLEGTVDERFGQVERHLRGLDQTMVEIGYRYGELRTAAKERKWEYAQYQTEKIDLSLRLALERRPKRAKSAQPFLDEAIPPLVEAIQAKDGTKLDVAVERVHYHCIQCHAAEKVLHFSDVVERIKERTK